MPRTLSIDFNYLCIYVAAEENLPPAGVRNEAVRPPKNQEVSNLIVPNFQITSFLGFTAQHVSTLIRPITKCSDRSEYELEWAGKAWQRAQG